jgi:PAS domain S-box-containing protein
MKDIQLLEELETIMSIIPVGIWKLSIDGSLTFVNKTFCDMTGISEEKFLAAHNYKELFDESAAAQCEISDKSAYNSKNSITSVEKIVFADGREHTLKITKKIRKSKWRGRRSHRSSLR